MSLARDHVYVTPAEYLAAEMRATIKHEYLDGTVSARAGTSIGHNTITLNLISALRAAVQGNRRRVHGMDIKVQIEAANSYYYPDALITCDERDRNAGYVVSYPRLIAEVLSRSTEAFDRGRKFRTYRLLASLQEYMLLDATQQAVEVFRRIDSGLWVLTPYGQDEYIPLSGIEGSNAIAVSSLYEDVDFDPPEEEPEA